VAVVNPSSPARWGAVALVAAVTLALLPVAAPAAQPLPNLLRPAPAAAPVAAAISADPAGSARGTMIMVHGGGWIGHDARAQAHLMDTPGALLRQRGWRVVSVDYDEGAAGLQDVLDTVGSELVRRTGNGPLCLYGESAGGHLALVAASRLRAVDCVIGLGAPTDLVHYAAEAAATSEPRAKLVAARIARYFGTTPEQLAPWDPRTSAPTTRADLLLLREGDDAVFSSRHLDAVHDLRPTTQVVDLEAGNPADLSTVLLHGTVSSSGRAAYESALGAFTDRAVSARAAERAAARTGCPHVSRSVREIGLARVSKALRCLARKRPPARSSKLGRGWRQTRLTMQGEVSAARIWGRLRETTDGTRALLATAAQRATVVVRAGDTRITLRAR